MVSELALVETQLWGGGVFVSTQPASPLSCRDRKCEPLLPSSPWRVHLASWTVCEPVVPGWWVFCRYAVLLLATRATQLGQASHVGKDP